MGIEKETYLRLARSKLGLELCTGHAELPSLPPQDLEDNGDSEREVKIAGGRG
jgi:hypothetical protein